MHTSERIDLSNLLDFFMEEQMNNTNLYYYDLPKNKIAQTPLKNRDDSKLMIIDKENNTITHKNFYNIIDFLNKDDVLVINTTKVIPARIYGKKNTGANIELLLTAQKSIDEWLCLVKPGKRLKNNDNININKDLSAKQIDILLDGKRLIKFYKVDVNDVTPINELIEKSGEMPLPHYIGRDTTIEDTEDYQTVYAQHKGSVAAPTAGLHFTNELLEKIKEKGIIIAEVILNVGLGTFKPVTTDKITDHIMHEELCEIPKITADIINNAKANSNKIIAVGTTTTRTLESFVENSFLHYGKKWTNIFIHPPKKLQIIDALITNFHLPESTLIMLVAAFAGYELTMKAYNIAIDEDYRFYSYGDAMFIL